MRLLIVGTLAGQLTTATKLAMDRGATVTHAADIAQALAVLRTERGADLLMLDVAFAIRELENTMHRAVLMATGAEIGPEAILAPDGVRLDQQRGAPPVAHAAFPPSRSRVRSSAAPSPRSSATSSWRRIAWATARTPPTCSASRSAPCATSSTNMRTMACRCRRPAAARRAPRHSRPRVWSSVVCLAQS
jgi:DNA-binding NtrC family response regulator